MTVLFATPPLIPLGYQQISPVAATHLTPPVGATTAAISVSTATARYRDDGTAPTGTNGVILFTGVQPFYYTGDLNAVQFISATGVLDILYYKSS